VQKGYIATSADEAFEMSKNIKTESGKLIIKVIFEYPFFTFYQKFNKFISYIFSYLY